MGPAVEKEKLPLTGRNLEQNLWEERRGATEPNWTSRQILAAVVRRQLSATDLRCSVCHRTRVVRFSYLMHQWEQQSRRGQWSTGHQYSGGQPPPQIPFQFIHLCFPKRTHPHISAHNSDAFMRDTGVYRVTSRQYDMNQLLSYQSPIWYSWFRNSCSIPDLSAPSLWHEQDTEIWRAARRFFTGTQRLLSLLKTEISCVKTNEALLIQLQSVFFETSRRVLAFLRSSEPSHAVTTLTRAWGECGKPVIKVQPVVLQYGEKVMAETREQHCPLLPRQPSAEA